MCDENLLELRKLDLHCNGTISYHLSLSYHYRMKERYLIKSKQTRIEIEEIASYAV